MPSKNLSSVLVYPHIYPREKHHDRASLLMMDTFNKLTMINELIKTIRKAHYNQSIYDSGVVSNEKQVFGRHNKSDHHFPNR